MRKNKQSRDRIPYGDENERAALHIAAYGGHKEFVKALLADARVDVNATDAVGFALCG